MKFLSLFIIIAFGFHSFGQTKNLYGKIVDSESNQPIFGVKVLVKSNDKIIAGGRTDFDGIYLFKNVNFSIDTVQISIEDECFHSNEISKLSLLNDSTLIDYILTPLNCETIVEHYCKYKSDSCDIYKMDHLMDHNRRKPRKKKKKSTLSEPEKVVYMMMESYPACCGSKTQYCKTHDYQY